MSEHRRPQYHISRPHATLPLPLQTQAADDGRQSRGPLRDLLCASYDGGCGREEELHQQLLGDLKGYEGEGSGCEQRGEERPRGEGSGGCDQLDGGLGTGTGEGHGVSDGEP